MRGGGKLNSSLIGDSRHNKKFAFTFAEGATHVDRQHSRRKFAFTLAEVLITLGIIGVVAAMVMPTLMTKVTDKVLETQFGKSKSIVANAYKMMMAKNSVMAVENLPFLSCNASDAACFSSEHKSVFNIIDDSSGNFSGSSLPADYSIDGVTDKSLFDWEDATYIFVTNDGMVFGMSPNDTNTAFDIVVDVNGSKAPNTVQKDLYKYRYFGAGTLVDVSGELADISTCSFDDLAACRTQQQCESLSRPFGNGTMSGSWSGGSCNIQMRW